MSFRFVHSVILQTQNLLETLSKNQEHGHLQAYILVVGAGILGEDTLLLGNYLIDLLALGTCKHFARTTEVVVDLHKVAAGDAACLASSAFAAVYKNFLRYCERMAVKVYTHLGLVALAAVVAAAAAAQNKVADRNYY